MTTFQPKGKKEEKKFMKKKHRRALCCMALLLSLLICLTACAQPAGNQGAQQTEAAPALQPSETAETLFVPGQYTGSAEGRNGAVTVEVAVDAEKILSVTVKEHSETPGISDPAFEKLPAAIVDAQGLGVDAVAGCTISSEAILEAAADALRQAGADVEALKQIHGEAAAVSSETLVYDTDVVVVGAGGAGVSAALSALEEGSRVLVVEKMSSIGGNTIVSGGTMNAAVEEVQKKETMTQQDLEVIKETLAVEPVDEYMARWQQNVAKEIEAYEANGETYLYDSPDFHKIQTYIGGDYLGNPELIEVLCDGAPESYRWLSELGAGWSMVYMAIGGKWARGNQADFGWGPYGSNLVLPQAKAFTENGGTILTEHRADTILMENGRAAGVSGVTADGQPFRVNAAKAVVLATGGFGANVEMRQQYNTKWPTLDESVGTSNPSSATGDGITMALTVNANLIGMEWIQLLTGGDKLFTSMITNDIYINSEGNRFVNEDARRDELSAAVLNQPGAFFWQITDAHTTQDILGGIAEGGEQIDDMVDGEKIFRADTIEDLAKQLDVDPEAFAAAVKAHNAAVDGTEADPFGRKLYQYKLDKAPYYAIRGTACVHYTMGGIEINKNAQVIDKNGAVIPGLFAAGETTGGIQGSNRLGGNSLAEIVTFGRIAGKNAAKDAA